MGQPTELLHMERFGQHEKPFRPRLHRTRAPLGPGTHQHERQDVRPAAFLIPLARQLHARPDKPARIQQVCILYVSPSLKIGQLRIRQKCLFLQRRRNNEKEQTYRHWQAGDSQTTIDTSSLTAGVYIMKVRMSDGTEFAEKIVKE